MSETNDLTQLLCFGKYKGQTIKQVMKHDAQYLLWAEGQGIISLSNDIQEAASECASIQHSDWLRDYCGNEQCIEF